MKFKIHLRQIIIILFFNLIVCITNSLYAATKESGISAFPYSYQVYLKQLKKLHPNWTYTALNTGLNWKEVIRNEGPNVNLERSAIHISFAEVWKWRNSSGNYNTIETGWVTASEKAVNYTMDPRKYLNEMQIFQFETLNYDSSTQNQEGVEKIFYGTLMYQNKIYYTDINGNKQTINKTYSKVVMEAAARYNVSPYHLASRIKQETACDINNNTSIKGNVSGYMGIYNYYNIGATGGDNPAISGLAYARTQGWTNPELAINGGAKYIAEKYINVGQYTTYLQKFNVNDDALYALYTHQYMQNIVAPSKEAISTYNAYTKMNLLDIPFNFVVPVYNNMPESPVDIYTSNASEFNTDSTKVYCTSNLNIRSAPGTEHSVILTAAKGTIMTRIAKGVQSGERWDKVRLSSGLEGYVFQNYIKEYNYVKVQDIKVESNNLEIGVGETYKLIAEVLPTNATYKDVMWQSNNEDIITVSDDGLVTGIKEGIAIVSLTSEDQLKSTNVIVTVKKKEPEIVLNKEKYNIIVGESSELNVIIKNSDMLEYEIRIDDENVAKVQNGRIFGISAGTTKLTINIKGTDVTKEAYITVINLNDGDILIDEALKVDGDIITKVGPGVTVEQLKDKVQTTYNLVLKNNEDMEITNSDLVGSNTKLQLLRENNEMVYEYKIIVYGDVTGDGKINSGDLLRIVKHLNQTNTFENTVIKKAADVNYDSKINSGDLLKIVKYLNNAASLES